jgi:hypothetical protein
VDDSWQAALLPEVISRIAAEERDFEPIDRAHWEQCRVDPVKARIRRSAEYGEESAFIVGRQGQAVIFFDDAQDGFAGAKLDARGMLQDCRFYGDLKHALRGFRRGPST